MSNEWMTTYDAVFFISVGTMVTGLIAIMIKYCLKSKCEHFSLCFGLIKIDRRVDLEVQEEMHALEMGVNDTDQPTQQQPTQPTKQPPQTQVNHQASRKTRRPSNEESDISDILDSGILNKI